MPDQKLPSAWKTAARGPVTRFKTRTYSGGEKSQVGAAAPGYKPFFMVAFFFAILHLPPHGRGWSEAASAW